MKEPIQEQIKTELKSGSYPFEEKHWTQLKAKMHNEKRSRPGSFLALALIGVLQMSVIFPFPSDSLMVSDLEQETKRSLVKTEDISISIDDSSSFKNTRLQPLREQESSEKKNDSSISLPQEPLVFKPLKSFCFNLNEPQKMNTKTSPLISNWQELSLYSSPTFNDFGIEYRFGISNSLFLSTGINYQSPSINITTQPSTQQVLAVNDNSYWVYQNTSYWEYTDSINSAGGWQYTDSIYASSIDSTYNSQIDSSFTANSIPAQNLNVTIRKVSIPLMIGYKKQFGRFECGFLVGGSIDFLTKTRIDGMENSIPVKFTQTNFSVLAGTFVNYRITPSWSIGVQPNFKYALKPDLIIDGNKERARYYSLRAYVRLRF